MLGIAGVAMMMTAVDARGENALVAVAANFAETAAELEREFERLHDYELSLTTGSTGKLYAQITYGAPYDILLAADALRPRLLEEAGLVVPGSRSTYATGRLALWSPDPEFVVHGPAALQDSRLLKLAMANPALAPYGEAAVETLRALGAYAALRERIVMGENAGQTYAMVATGNAELGFVPLSHVVSRRNAGQGSHWVVPAELHAPITQDVVMLRQAEHNPAARAFLDFLAGSEARRIILSHGYLGNP